MINSITKTIRRHIRTSREGVQQMNTAMSAMNTSSTLRLSLQWKGRKAENDQELDSRELITLLETDAQIMEPQDQQRLAGHFRNRLAAVRKEAEKEENQQSFHHIMQEVMDYRRWFEFTILYQRGDEKKKEFGFLLLQRRRKGDRDVCSAVFRGFREVFNGPPGHAADYRFG